ncbi:uncharacterized protein LOC106654406 [Trichogramma pretiosum]|uniref:uncharacterized protein LOC106654406 n=1 Tax=Trichogramma pretiosum TaxID=7493 RepID=UPI0006C968D4|nr:uncharacterized protein LOC106654406 [Trichogramma pretiosum]
MENFLEDMKKFVGKLKEHGREQSKMALVDRQQNEQVCKEMDTVRKQMAESGFKSSEISVICRNFAKTNNFLYRCAAMLKHDSKFHASCFEWAGHCLAYAQPGSMEHVLGLQTRAKLHYHCGNWEECRQDAADALDLMDSGNIYDQMGTTMNTLRQLLVQVVGRSLVTYIGSANRDRSTNMWHVLNPRFLKPQLKRPNANHPCLSDGVEPAYSPERGRHLVAKRDIEVGEMILVEDLACGVLTQKAVHTKCAHCLAQAWVGPACDKCVNAVYCSKQCKTEAWRDYHYIECDLFQMMDSDKERELAVPALRLLIKSIRKEGLKQIIQIADTIDRNRESFHKKLPMSSEYAETPETKYCFTDFGLIYGLLDRANYDEKFERCIKKIRDSMDVEQEKRSEDYMETDELPDQQYDLPVDVENEKRSEDHMGTDELPDQQYDLVLKNVLRKCKSNDIDKDTMRAIRRIFKKLKLIFHVNHSYFGWVPDRKSIKTTTLDINSFALSYYSSLLNHSCFHNCMMSIGKGGKLIVYALYPIKQNEQITISYMSKVTWNMDATIRKLNLALQKSFFCRCQGCVEGWSISDGQLSGPINSTVCPRILAQAELGLYAENGNTWYLTRQQIDALKDIIKDCFEDLKETSPMIALKLADVYIRCLIQAYHLMYGVECAAPEECHSLPIVVVR